MNTCKNMNTSVLFLLSYICIVPLFFISCILFTFMQVKSGINEKQYSFAVNMYCMNTICFYRKFVFLNSFKAVNFRGDI